MPFFMAIEHGIRIDPDKSLNCLIFMPGIRKEPG